jgi:hypothetical protein
MTAEQARQVLYGSGLGVCAPPAGLEPATYGLEVRHHPSAWSYLGASPQVASSLSSAWLHPRRHSDSEGIAKEIASTSGLNEASDLLTA